MLKERPGPKGKVFLKNSGIGLCQDKEGTAACKKLAQIGAQAFPEQPQAYQ